MKSNIFKTSLHTPAHLFRDDSIYIVTASTYQRKVFIESDSRKTQWRNVFFKACELYQWNDEDKKSGRKIWWNYWDTCIRSEKDFEARLYYVFWNPGKHGLVSHPEEYDFSNYRKFLQNKIPLEPFDPTIEVNDVPEF